MKTYIKTDNESEATGAYLSYRRRQSHIPVKEVEIPTEEEIETEAYRQYNQGHEYLTDECKAYIRGAKDLLSKLK